MVSEEDRVRVLDFGLAKLQSPEGGLDPTELPTQTLTQQGLALGTVPYMSPEQARGQEADTRSDIFSLGILLYEMATGVRPFGGGTSMDLILSIIQDSPRPIVERRPDAPAGLDRVIRRCLEKEPARRYQSVLDLQHDLEEIGAEAEEEPAESEGRKSWPTRLRVGGLLVVALIGIAGWWWMQGRAKDVEPVVEDSSAEARALAPDTSRLVAKRVLVVPFENRTGDPSLDSVGMMAADWITQGLTQTGLVEMVSSISALSSAQGMAQAVSDGSDSPTISALAADTGAGTVISGAYYLQGGEYLFSAEASDAVSGQLIGAVEPARAGAENPLTAVEELRQRLMVIVASHLDDRLGSLVQQMRIPSFAAYREHALGVEKFIQMDFQAAVDHLQRASELDPEWNRPLLTAAMARLNMGQFAEAEALAQKAALHRDALSTLDQHFLDRILTTCQEKPLESLQFARLTAELSPEGPAAFDAGAMAVRTNHAQEAQDRLVALDPERGFLRGFAPYWYYLTEAHHVLGDHDAELESARRARELYPDSLEPRWYQIRALVGMGRSGEIDPLLDAAEALPTSSITPGWVMEMTAKELRAHGFPEAARRVAQRAVQWYRNRPAEQMSQGGWQASLGRSLIAAGRIDEALILFAALANEESERLGYRGAYGVLKARSPDPQSAQPELDWLRQVDRRFVFGAPFFWRSAIHAWQGDLDQAVRLYREALAAGLPFGWPRIHPHADPLLEPLWDYPPFQQLIAPRG